MRMLRRDLNDRMVSQTSEMLENGSHVEGAVALLRVTQLAASNFFLGSFSFFFQFGIGSLRQAGSGADATAGPIRRRIFPFLPGGTASTAGKKKTARRRKRRHWPLPAILRLSDGKRLGQSQCGPCVCLHFGRRRCQTGHMWSSARK